MKFLALLSVAGLAAAAPLTPNALPKLPRRLDIKGSDVPIVGELVTEIVNALPVDVSVSALDNDKRAIEVDLGGAGVSLKNKRAVEVDLGGAGVSLKDKRSLLDGLDISGSDVPLLGQLLTQIVNALPVNVSVSALDNDKRALEVDLGGAGLDLKNKRALEVDLGAAGLDLKNKRALEVDLGGAGLDLKNKRALEVDLGGAGVSLKNKRALEVDLGGAGVSLKNKRALLDGLDISGSDIPLLGQLLTEIVNALPVNVSVSALDN